MARPKMEDERDFEKDIKKFLDGLKNLRKTIDYEIGIKQNESEFDFNKLTESAEQCAKGLSIVRDLFKKYGFSDSFIEKALIVFLKEAYNNGIQK